MDQRPEGQEPPYPIGRSMEGGLPPSGLAPARRPRSYAAVAWVVIILACGAQIAQQFIDFSTLVPKASKHALSGDDQEHLANMLLEAQAKYMVGAAHAAPEEADSIYGMVADALDTGSVSQRQRFIVLTAEMLNAREAAQALAELDALIQNEQDRDGENPFQITPSQARVQNILHQLYDHAQAETDAPAVENLSHADRIFLETELGWFGRLALAPKTSDSQVTRKAILAPAQRLMTLIVAGTVIAIIAAIGGLAGLVVLFVLALMGKVSSGLQRGQAHHGLYAETFAAWMLIFLALQALAGIAGAAVPDLALLLAMVAFMGSLLALIWPVMRGATWRQVRHDIGWTLGKRLMLEPLLGVAGYCMALVLLAVGFTMTFVLILLQERFSAPGPIFSPNAGPAHPIILQLTGNDWWVKAQILFLAVVGAPVVEETMFRGVFYRHLRDATGRMGTALSVLISGIINAFIFAAIHPQGWVTIPALMSLAFMFIIMREWRGTLIPAMIIHGISNFLVMSIVILAFQA